MIEYYKRKRDEMKRAYRAALEMEDMKLAERLFKEYENYKRVVEKTTNA